MAFLIPDNLRSRPDVPPGARRTAGAFQAGLDDSVCVWFEPLFDPSKKKPSFVVLFPDRGIVVLETLDVKEGAMLGALRGRLRFLRDGREVEAPSPLARAENLANVLQERVNAEGRLAGLDLKIASGAVFPAMTIEEAKKKGIGEILPLDSCLFKADIEEAIAGSGESGLLRAFNRMFGGQLGGEIPEDKEKILRGIIQPEIVIDRLSGSGPRQLSIFRPAEDGEDLLRVMDRRQEAMAKSLGEGHRVIRGVAGSGKTLVLVYRAKLLAGMWPGQRFLVTCYTRSLAGQLRFLLREYRNIEVVHLESLMARTIREAGMRYPGYRDDPTGEAVALAALEALNEIGDPVHYRAVLIDEAQDFCTAALQFALRLIQPGKDDLLIVADAAQNIFRRRFSWRQAGIRAQGRTRILKINYRNTRQILEFAYGFLVGSGNLRVDDDPDLDDENAVIPPETAAREGPRPITLVCEDIEDEVASAVERAVEWVGGSRSPKILAILYASSGSRHHPRAQRFYDSLKARGIDTFWLSDPNDRSARDSLAEVSSPVILSTIDSAKGLEFPYVVLCGLRRKQDLDSNRRLAYVGMTRATDRLAVITARNDPFAADLAAIQV